MKILVVSVKTGSAQVSSREENGGEIRTIPDRFESGAPGAFPLLSRCRLAGVAPTLL
jgi:hypothetical protein